jgi:hypothetical protein
MEWLENLVYICEGYAIWIWNGITGKTRELVKKRLNICNNCEHNKHGICELCGCILKAKTRVDFPLDENNKSIDGCPEKKW